MIHIMHGSRLTMHWKGINVSFCYLCEGGNVCAGVSKAVLRVCMPVSVTMFAGMLSVCLSISLLAWVCLSVCLSVRPSVCLSACLPVCLTVFCNHRQGCQSANHQPGRGLSRQ